MDSAITTNPQLRTSTRVFAAITSLVLLTTCTPFFTPISDPAPWWPWNLTPFNARFLGAVYIAQTIDAVILLVVLRWSPGRLILSMGAVFSAISGVTTIMNIDYFEFSRPSAPFWFAFLGFTLVAQLYFLWLYRGFGPVGKQTHGIWRIYLMIQSTILGVYGVMMFLLPAASVSFWPWPVDDFHARVYSAVFISGAVGAYLLSRIGAFWDFFTIGVSHAAFGFFAILGTVLVDAATHRVNWSAPGTWLWLALFGWLLVAGVAITLYAFYRRSEEFSQNKPRGALSEMASPTTASST